MNKLYALRFSLVVFCLVGLSIQASGEPCSRPIEEVQYPRIDDPTRMVPGFLVRPEGEGPFPAIVFVHGGGGDRPGDARSIARRYFVCDYVDNGYLILSTDYRNHWGAYEYRDALAAINYLLGLPELVDANRIGIAGGSHGGYIVLRVMQEDARYYGQRVVKAGVDFFGVKYFPPPLISAYSGINRMDAPLMIIHGALDLLVPARESRRFVEAMVRAGREVYYLEVPGAEHGFILDETEVSRETMTRSIEFFNLFFQ